MDAAVMDIPRIALVVRVVQRTEQPGEHDL
ncbi:MAG: hypothetical protein FD153_1558 [Rhodospirillaceae bacterium]|nr:MAG: hypothetical protein FD153_1558 [Rhodospirillaceae bacterium]